MSLNTIFPLLSTEKVRSCIFYFNQPTGYAKECGVSIRSFFSDAEQEPLLHLSSVYGMVAGELGRGGLLGGVAVGEVGCWFIKSSA
ncbi:hypothetical protein MF1_11100 [Bartonella quintana]|uniref:hypothetical protein n=1 Tax=Bartonella quintana TaxID=803 RepID=UPI001315C50E|nr:hypothetical protein [Bartonella quintana]BBL53852.1 hypothetical protein MF1_11100 [Bartonella quintana]